MNTTKAVTIRLEKEHLDMLADLSKKTGKTKTDIIKTAISNYYRSSSETSKQLMLLEEKNKQLEMMSKTFSLLIQEKDKLLQEKDLRIEEIKQQRRGFFAKLFGVK